MMTYAQQLINWYDTYKREMPWRKTRNPYYIWVSEVMLQQTQVDTVIPYYTRFIERFDTIEALATASEEEVYQYWQGLGYYRRAKNLHAGAKVVLEKYQGVFPSEPSKVKEIPGIGPYTLGAVMSIAFDLPLPAVDGNVMRILSRQFLIDEDIAKAKSRKVFEEKVMELMPNDPHRFNQALMELGATVCTPRQPKCETCPVQNLCQGYEEGVMLEYPVKSKKNEQAEESYHVLVLKKDRSIYMEKRPDRGLLANLWGMPLVEGESWERIKEVTDKRETVPCIKHIFTHKKWFMHPEVIAFDETLETKLEEVIGLSTAITEERGKWIPIENLSSYPIGTAFTKVINSLLDEDEK